MAVTVNVIIRIDDIFDKYDFYELKKWFVSNYPQIPISFYVMATHHSYYWNKKAWNEIKNVIIEYKWEIGGHTRDHPYLSNIPSERQKSEIVNNIMDIEKGLESAGLEYEITSFAYPYGDFDERVKKVLKENGIVHGLTYVANEIYDNQLNFPKDNLFEIGISCNATNSVDDWNIRFKDVYEKGDTYILCLHTSHWTRGQNRKNLARILKSGSIKEIYFSLRRFAKYIFKKSSVNMWKNLKKHLEFILTHSNVNFITFKDLLEKG